MWIFIPVGSPRYVEVITAKLEASHLVSAKFSPFAYDSILVQELTLNTDVDSRIYLNTFHLRITVRSKLYVQWDRYGWLRSSAMAGDEVSDTFKKNLFWSYCTALSWRITALINIWLPVNDTYDNKMMPEVQTNQITVDEWSQNMFTVEVIVQKHEIYVNTVRVIVNLMLRIMARKFILATCNYNIAYCYFLLGLNRDICEIRWDNWCFVFN